MFLLYYLWNLVNFLVYFNLNFLNNFFLKFNKFNLIFKKNFEHFTFLEKLFLIFFTKNNWFLSSLCTFKKFDKKVYDLTKDNYPLIHFFNLYGLKSDIKLKNIFLLEKQYSNLNLNSRCFNFYNWLVLQVFFYNKYYILINSSFFKFFNQNNLIKLNYLFNEFFNLNFVLKKNFIFIKFNLNYYNDWFNYMFNKDDYIHFNLNNSLNKDLHFNFKNKKLIYVKKIILIYKSIFNLNGKFVFSNNYFYSNLNFFKNNFLKKIILKKNYFKFLSVSLPIRFSDSSINKYINLNNLNNYNFLYIRKNRIFNKGRYSRNRQLYRTGVYWCLWLNIIIVYGLYFFFYRFTFNFGYLWLGLFILIFSTIFSRVLKYKFYNLYYLYNEFYNLFTWFGLILKNIYIFIKILLLNFNKKNDLNKLLFNKSNYLIYYFLNLFYKFFLFFSKKNDYGFVFVWENYRHLDKSFLRYKSILNWFVQLYKVLIF